MKGDTGAQVTPRPRAPELRQLHLCVLPVCTRTCMHAVCLCTHPCVCAGTHGMYMHTVWVGVVCIHVCTVLCVDTCISMCMCVPTCPGGMEDTERR